jgi:hypothetical protein
MAVPTIRLQSINGVDVSLGATATINVTAGGSYPVTGTVQHPVNKAVSQMFIEAHLDGAAAGTPRNPPLPAGAGDPANISPNQFNFPLLAADFSRTGHYYLTLVALNADGAGIATAWLNIVVSVPSPTDPVV